MKISYLNSNNNVQLCNLVGNVYGVTITIMPLSCSDNNQRTLVHDQHLLEMNLSE